MNNNPYTQKQQINGEAKGTSSFKHKDHTSLKGNHALKKDSKLGHKSLSPRPIDSPKDQKVVTTVIKQRKASEQLGEPWTDGTQNSSLDTMTVLNDEKS